jgi:hypothetical protein
MIRIILLLLTIAYTVFIIKKHAVTYLVDKQLDYSYLATDIFINIICYYFVLTSFK